MYYLSKLLFNGNPITFHKNIISSCTYTISDSDTDFIKVINSKELKGLIRKNVKIYGVTNEGTFVVDKKSTLALDYLDNVELSPKTGVEFSGFNFNSKYPKSNNFTYTLTKTGDILIFDELIRTYQSNSILTTYSFKNITIYNFLVQIFKYYPELVNKQYIKVIFKQSDKYFKGENVHPILNIYLTSKFGRWYTKNLVLEK
jgi:hypothetical protein